MKPSLDCDQSICNIPVLMIKQSLFWDGYIRSSYSYAIKFWYHSVLLILILSSLANFLFKSWTSGRKWTAGILALVTVFLIRKQYISIPYLQNTLVLVNCCSERWIHSPYVKNNQLTKPHTPNPALLCIDWLVSGWAHYLMIRILRCKHELSCVALLW